MTSLEPLSGARTSMDRNHGKYMVVLYTKPADCGGTCLYCIRERALTRSTLLNEDTRLAQTTGWSSSGQLRQRLRDARLQLGTGLKLELRIKGNSFTNYDPASELSRMNRLAPRAPVHVPIELYEFVRMAAIHLFEEMAPPEEHRAHGEADPDAPTLH